MFHELLNIVRIPGKPYIRYTRMYNLLNRICIEQSADFKSDYATLFSRLVAVCNALSIEHRPIDRFRHNARLVMNNEWEPGINEEQADIADLCWFIKQVYHIPIPDNLPQHIRTVKVKNKHISRHKSWRAVITKITSAYTFECLLDGSNIVYKIEITERNDTLPANRPDTSYLYQGANVILLDPEVADGATDSLNIYMVVLEPDYLIDVTSLTTCLKAYGSSPLNFLLSRFSPTLPNKYTLLGNMANQFMDDCINEPDSEDLYQRSVYKNYEQSILDFACCTNEELGEDFFQQARKQFEHIQTSVKEQFCGSDVKMNPEQVLLEPAFICPTLGLRGRLDVMTMDHLRILELKSGKADEYNKDFIRPKPDHLRQMMLYGEILRRNFGIEWSRLHTYLFYSSYPLFLHERASATAIRDILNLRNGIVNLMHHIMQGRVKQIISLCNPEHLNENNLHSSFYDRYLLPQIRQVTDPLQNMFSDELLCNYFTSFLTFVEREHFLTKTNDNRPDSIRGFAATWTADLHSKLVAGNILTQLTIQNIKDDGHGGITALQLHIPEYDGDFIPNFAEGVTVQLYEAEDEQANVTNRQLIRGTITQICASTLTIELSYKQRNLHLFSQDKHYNIEHDCSDGPSNQQYRNLFSFITASPERQDLLLGRRAPKADPNIRLIGKYPPHVNDIILQSKQALDYYLLVGPPGTGKTNVALRSMVKEFLLERQNKNEKNDSILLTAYTNRAVDEICSMLSSLSKEMEFDYLRIGSRQTCATEHQPHLLSERACQLTKRKEAQELLDRTPIFVGTVMTLTNNQILFHRKHFSVAIIDEASQILEPQALGLLSAQYKGCNAIDKFILIGDHKQLPAVVLLPEKQTSVDNPLLQEIGLTNLRNSLFERLHWLETKNQRNQFIGTLNHQGRMHKSICDFVNEHFYNNVLQTVPLPHQEKALEWNHAEGKYETFVASTRMGFIDVNQTDFVENLRANAPEAEIIYKLIQAICDLHKKNGFSNFAPAKQIGVIVPFRSQIAGVRSILRKHDMEFGEEMTIDTVECYQGSQRDYIIFSTTISQNYQLEILSSVQNIDNISVDRKLNVAITRARLQFFMVGSERLLSKSNIYNKLIKSCQKLE